MKNTSNETKEINEAGRFTTKFVAERWVHIRAWQALSWVFIVCTGAFLAGMGGSTYIKFNTALSLPGRVAAIEKELMTTQTKYMPLDLSLEKWKQNDDSHNSLIKKLDQIDAKMDSIRNLIK